MKRLVLILSLSHWLAAATAATSTVSSIADLNRRISGAVAGDTIIVKNGVYSTRASIAVNRVGAKDKPIVIQAEMVRQAVPPFARRSAHTLSSRWIWTGNRATRVQTRAPMNFPPLPLSLTS